MKVYISGKITGLDIEEAKKNFQTASGYLIVSGHDPINPMDLVPYREDYTWKDYMIADIRLLLDCEGIYMLNNWQDSKGAKVEHHIAVELGLEIMYQ